MLRLLAAILLAAAALFAAGCGDDAENNEGGSQAAALSDVEPRASTPNILGDDAPIAALSQKAGNDAITYFGAVFEKSGVDYATPTVTVLTSAGESCGQPFDPATQAFYLCAAEPGSDISLGAGKLDAIRSSAGDSAP